MRSKEPKKKTDGQWNISFAHILRHSVLFCLLLQ